MKERTPEMETAALLRRLKRQGVREVEWDSRAKRGTVRLRAKVQAGRAHKRVETGEHDTQEEALAELSQLVADAAPRAKGGRRQKSTARRLHRPEAGHDLTDAPGAPELPPAKPEREPRTGRRPTAVRAQPARPQRRGGR